MTSSPPGWTTATLADLATSPEAISYGVLKPGEYRSDGVPMLRVTDISRNVVAEENVLRISPELDAQYKRTRLNGGEVVVSIQGTVGRVAIVPKSMCGANVSRTIAVIPLKEPRMARWIRVALLSPQGQELMASETGGTTRASLNLGELRKVRIPVPPLSEQKRIADKLDRLLAAVDTCKARLDAIPGILKRFRQSVLAAAVSGDLTKEWRTVHGLPQTWRDVRLDEIADIQGGVTKDSKKQRAADREVPYLRVANVQRGYLDLSEVKTIRVPEAKLASLLLEPGDVLFTEGGDIDKLGRGWIWEGQIENCSYQNHIFRARLFDRRDQPKYISWWGNSRGLSYFLGRGKQTTNLASINKSQLSALPVSLPSPEEQIEIVREVEKLLSAADRLEEKVSSARSAVEKLEQSLLMKAFRGEIVPQDPSDEPAERVLGRIKSQAEPARHWINGTTTFAYIVRTPV